jgi:hypothetical protein
MTELIADEKATTIGGVRTVNKHRQIWPGTTRRGVQVTLGVLWLMDATLQLQPYMFTTAFARQVLAPAGQDQPGWVAGPVDFFAHLIAAHPASLNTAFVLIQLALGIGFLVPRLVRPAILGSLAWSAALWWLSEGLGGLVTGHASLITGAPGAVLLYAVLASAAWPANDHRSPHDSDNETVAGWLPSAWAILWIGGAWLEMLPNQRGGAGLRDQIGSTDGVPAWLAGLHHSAEAILSHGGNAPSITLVVVMALVGLVGLAGRPWRTAAAAAGALAAAAFWILGQNIGQLYSGQATDPNTGPLIVLMAFALAGTTRSLALPTSTRSASEPISTAGITNSRR